MTVVLVVDLVQKLETLNIWDSDPIGGTTGSMLTLMNGLLLYQGCSVTLATKTGDGCLYGGIYHESIDKYKELIDRSDVVIINSRMNTNILQYARSKHKRVIYVTGDLPSVERTYWLFDKTWVDMVDNFVFKSDFHKNEMLSCYGDTLSEHNCHSIYNPVDVRFGEYYCGGRVGNRLIYAGVPCKCINSLPIVLQELSVHNQCWSCEVYSSNDLYNNTGELPGSRYSDKYDESFRLLRRMNNVHVNDIVNKSKLSRVLNEISIFVHTQDYEETCGTTMLEAMFAGVVVVSVGKGSAKELIRHNENGILVNDTSDKYSVMAREINDLLNSQNKLKELSTNAMISVNAVAHPSIITDRYMSLF